MYRALDLRFLITEINEQRINPNFASLSECHCEEPSDEVIPSLKDCFAVARNDRNGEAFQKPLRNSGSKKGEENDYVRSSA